jgi:uncharacterized integral membrane protein
MKMFFYLVLFLVLLLLGVTFTIQNPQDVFVQYYLGFTWRGPLVILISGSLAIGIIIGCLAGLAKNIRLRRKYSQLAKTSSSVIGRNNQSTAVVNPKA